MADLQMVVCITLPQTVIALYIRTYVYTHRSRSATLQPAKTQTVGYVVCCTIPESSSHSGYSLRQLPGMNYTTNSCPPCVAFTPHCMHCVASTLAINSRKGPFMLPDLLDTVPSPRVLVCFQALHNNTKHRASMAGSNLYTQQPFMC